MYEKGMDLVVVNYKTPQDLNKFCSSFQANLPPDDWTLSIVNNCPTGQDKDVTVRWVKTLPQVESFTFEDNVGYAVAANFAASKGNKETIAIFNADVEILPRSLTECHTALQENPSWGVLGPRQVDRERRLTHGGIFGSASAPKFREWLQPDRGVCADIRSAVTVSGSAFFVKRQVWDELTGCELFRKAAPDALGAYLPTPLYYEETYAAYHARAHGWKVIYYGPTVMVHNWHQSVKKNRQELYARQCLTISRRLFRDACDIHNISHDMNHIR